MIILVNDGTVHYPLLQAPGVWLYPNENKLSINMNTWNNPRDSTIITIPVGKWVNIALILVGQSLDIFLNCSLIKRHKLSSVPKLNYQDLHINYFGGYQGYMSKFRYYPYALQPYEIEQICKNPPGTLDDLANNLTAPPYLSKKYYLTTGHPSTVTAPQ